MMIKKILYYFLINFYLIAATASAEPLSLSLDEAIVLAVRKNPNVLSSRLSALSQKFNLSVEEWKFMPHPGFATSVFYNHDLHLNQAPTTSHVTNIQPSLTWMTPLGGNVSINGINTSKNGYQPGLSFEIMQPLLKGFGKPIVESTLKNAIDSAYITHLNGENVLRQTVTEVINTYLNIILAENIVRIDQDSLQRAEKSVQQTEIFIKAGHKAKNELVTVRADVAIAKTQLENDRNNLLQAKYNFLAAIGIDPNKDIQIDTQKDINILTNKYSTYDLETIKALSLKNNIQYQIDQLTLSGQKTRDIMVAKDNLRSQLDFSAALSTGNGIVNAEYQSHHVGFTLKIPIDDLPAKVAYENSKIAYQEAIIALRKEKWAIETNAINAWNNLKSNKTALLFAHDAEELQEKTYQISYQKYVHGLIDSLELQTALKTLTQTKHSFLVANINYLQSLVNLDLIIGHTLNTWNIEVRQ